MSAFYYEPFYDFDRFFASLGASNNNAQGQLLLRNSDGAVQSLRPRMDLHENPEQNTVTATFELPGLKKEDVQIDAHNGRLTVSGQSKISTEHKENGYAVRERRYGQFSRTLQLPRGVKHEEIKASMDNGVLTISFPKSTPELAPRKIMIA